MPMDLTYTELLFLVGVTLVIAFLVAGEMLEQKRLRQSIRTRGRGSIAVLQVSDERAFRHAPSRVLSKDSVQARLELEEFAAWAAKELRRPR
jgi:hypothetical protein